MKIRKPKRKTRTAKALRSINKEKQEKKQKVQHTSYKASRKLARALARANMKRKGLCKLNHRVVKGGDSLFAREWRKYV